MAVGGEWYGIADENNKMGKSRGLEFDNVFVPVSRPPVQDEQQIDLGKYE